MGANSPLTGGFGTAEVGGFWGAELRHAGWDAMIVTGQATEPVYLWIYNEKVEIRDAAHLWGKEIAQVEEIVQAELGDKHIRVAQCGVADEICLRDQRHQPGSRTHRIGRGHGR